MIFVLACVVSFAIALVLCALIVYILKNKRFVYGNVIFHTFLNIGTIWVQTPSY